MGIITWGNELSIGIDGIDRQHKKLVDLINAIHDAMKQGKAKDIMAKVLKELTDYTVQHFSAEEQFMVKHQYPGYEAHREEHQKLIRKVLAITKDFEAGKLSISMEIMSFLKDWLKDHICVTDKKYAPFFKEKGFV